MTIIKIHLRGTLSQYISANDIGIHIQGILGTESACGKTIEFSGPAFSVLSNDDRNTLSDMMAAIGAADSIVPPLKPSKKTRKNKASDGDEQSAADVSATNESTHETSYEAIYDVNISDIEPTVASNCSSFDIGSINNPINATIIGGLSGNLSDIKAAYEIIKGRHVANGVDAILIPESPEVYKEAIKKGYIEEFIDAGFRIFPPGFIPENNGRESCLSTMSTFDSIGFTASPQVVAASSLTGLISDPRIVDSKAERKAEKKTEKQLEKAEKLAEKAEKAAEKARKAKAAK